MSILRIEGLHHGYGSGRRRLEVLRGVDLDVEQGEIVGLLGQSGSGKSTLLHVAGLLESLQTGRLAIDGEDMAGIGDDARTAIRRAKLGFVYQFHHLLPEFSAVENVVLPQRIAGTAGKAARDHATDLLTKLGLAERLDHRPAQLSGGEQQRVAIARALANGPLLLLADEPTGNLDEATADRVMDELIEAVRQTGLSALIATHNLDLARKMDRTVILTEGHIAAPHR